jgi:hypothetical protein
MAWLGISAEPSIGTTPLPLPGSQRCNSALTHDRIPDEIAARILSANKCALVADDAGAVFFLDFWMYL